MKAHIGVDARSGLIHTLTGTAANVADIAEPTPCSTGKKGKSMRMRVTQVWRSVKRSSPRAGKSNFTWLSKGQDQGDGGRDASKISP